MKRLFWIYGVIFFCTAFFVSMQVTFAAAAESHGVVTPPMHIFPNAIEKLVSKDRLPTSTTAVSPMLSAWFSTSTPFGLAPRDRFGFSHMRSATSTVHIWRHIVPLSQKRKPSTQ